MHYVSTRGEGAPVGFTDAMLAGLARDGGLYMPQSYPQLPHTVIAGFAGRPYAQVARAVISPFVGADLSGDALGEMIDASYAGFRHAAVTPLVQIDGNLFILELFHGPTLAFKDVAMQLLGRLMNAALKARGARATIVGATSGDTGAAAIEAFRGLDRIDVFILLDVLWRVPVGVKWVRVRLVGGGGGGGGGDSGYSGGGGGAGGYSEALVSVRAGQLYWIVVGGAGAPGGTGASGSAGGIAALPGWLRPAAGRAAGRPIRTAMAGGRDTARPAGWCRLAGMGGDGSTTAGIPGGNGGGSAFGGGGRGADQGGVPAIGLAAGSGGGGGYGAGSPGGAGAPGLVVVEY